jgi:hypothetical protein
MSGIEFVFALFELAFFFGEMEAEMKMVFQQKVAEKESKLKQSEDELYARHRERLVARSIGKGKSNGRDMDISEARSPFACPSLRRANRAKTNSMPDIAR